MGNIDPLPDCPKCESQDVWRNGWSRSKKQQWRCKTCGKVWVAEPYKPDWVFLVTDRMLQENMRVSSIATVLKGYVSRRWIYSRRENMHVG